MFPAHHFSNPERSSTVAGFDVVTPLRVLSFVSQTSE